jgi:hypothetical protein
MVSNNGTLIPGILQEMSGGEFRVRVTNATYTVFVTVMNKTDIRVSKEIR